MEEDARAPSLPAVSRCGRVLRKSAKRIEAEESLLMQDSESLEPRDCWDGTPKEGEKSDCKPRPASNRSALVSSTCGDETSMCFEISDPHSEHSNSFPLNDAPISFRGVLDATSSILHENSKGTHFASRPDPLGSISMDSTDDDEEASSAEESPLTPAASLSVELENLLSCRKRGRGDHKFCTRWRQAQNAEPVKVDSKNSTEKLPLNRTQSGYALWSGLQRRSISAGNANWPRKEISKRVAKAWKTLSVEEKQFWARTAEELSRRIQTQGVRFDFASEANVVPGPSSSYETPWEDTKSSGDCEEGHVPDCDRRSRKKMWKQKSGEGCDAPGKRSVMRENENEDPVLGIAPIDAAAHLKLLGDSLADIGQKISRADFEPSPAGVYSVLLDSLLCSLGALLCLSREIPGLEHLPTVPLTKTLDHIAYFFPGL